MGCWCDVTHSRGPVFSRGAHPTHTKGMRYHKGELGALAAVQSIASAPRAVAIAQSCMPLVLLVCGASSRPTATTPAECIHTAKQAGSMRPCYDAVLLQAA